MTKANGFNYSKLALEVFPGRPVGDGPDGQLLMAGLYQTYPMNLSRRIFPLVIEKSKTIADSGWCGLHRGGNGLTVRISFLADGQN